MDRTALFRACVQSACARDKSRARASGGSSSRDRGDSSSRASSHAGSSLAAAEFGADSRRLSASIAQLSRLLLSRRAAYITPVNTTGAAVMSDAECDEMDASAEHAVRSCVLLVRQLRHVAGECDEGARTTPCHVCQHRCVVVDLLEGRLREVCRLMAEMRETRSAAVKACLLRGVSGSAVASEGGDSGVVRQRKGAPADSPGGDRLMLNRRDTVPLLLEDRGSDSLTLSASSRAAVEEEDERRGRGAEEENGLSAEELQLLQTENAELFDELNSMSDEVRRVQASVVRVAQLQEVFTEKVLEQDREIDRVADLLVSSTENISAGNEQLRGAIRNNASTRVCVLFFILVISFSILFLNWFHP